MRGLPIAAQPRRVGGGVEEVGLEAIQRLDPDLDPRGLDHRRELLPAVDRALPFLGGPPSTGQEADRHGTGELRGAEIGAARTHAVTCSRARCAQPRIRGREARAAGDVGDRRPREADAIQLAADRVGRQRGRIEDRHFDAVEAGVLQPRQQMEVRRAEVAPQM